MADATEIDISWQSMWPSTTIATTWQQNNIIGHCWFQQSNVYSVNMLKWLIRYDNICVFSRIDIGIRLPNSKTILDLELWFFYLRPSSNWGYREHKDNMIIIVGHMYLVLVYYYNNYKTFWAIILLRANGVSIDFVYCNDQRQCPCPMGFRKNRVQTVTDQFCNRASSSSFCRCLHILCTIFICSTV